MKAPLLMSVLSAAAGALAPPANPYAAYALALDFKNSVYWDGAASHTDLTTMPGYAYARTGAKAELSATAVTAPFAVNTPAVVPSYGYYSETAFTNLMLWSQDFTNANWINNNITVTSGFTAPDGTASANLLTPTATSSFHRSYVASDLGGPSNTFSAFVKANGYSQIAFREDLYTGAAAVFTLSGAGTVNGTFDAGGVTVSNAQIVALANGWYRISATFTGSGAGMGIHILDGTWTSGGVMGSFAGDTVSGVYVWQAQAVAGSLPGPVIATTSAVATAAADNLAVSLPNGTYSAIYTFVDGSTQTVSTTVSGGLFTLPRYDTTLNKLPIALVTLV